MTNEKKDKIIDRVIDFLHNKPLKSDMRIAAALIEELKSVKNCSMPAVVGQSEQLKCEKCGAEFVPHLMKPLTICDKCADSFAL